MLPKQHLSSTNLASGMPLFTSQLKSYNFQLMTRRMRSEASLQIYVYPGGGSCEGDRDNVQKRYCREARKDEDRDVLTDVCQRVTAALLLSGSLQRVMPGTLDTPVFVFTDSR